MSIVTKIHGLPTDERIILEELLDYLYKNPSSFIDPHKILRHRGFTTKKILSLFDVLEREKIGKRIYPFPLESHEIKLINYFKFYFFDSSFIAANEQNYRPDQKGALLEQSFFSRICQLDLTINTFRTVESIEVDFIIQKKGDPELWAIEIKKDQFIYAADLAGLHFFDKAVLGKKNLIVAHAGTRDNFEGKIHITPIVNLERELTH